MSSKETQQDCLVLSQLILPTLYYFSCTVAFEHCKHFPYIFRLFAVNHYVLVKRPYISETGPTYLVLGRKGRMLFSNGILKCIHNWNIHKQYLMFWFQPTSLSTATPPPPNRRKLDKGGQPTRTVGETSLGPVVGRDVDQNLFVVTKVF